MSFSRYIAFSIVASSVLCGAQAYTDWNGGNFSDGDIVNITANAITSGNSVLKTNIILQSGTLTANININGSYSTCGIVACLSNPTTFGSQGSTIDFNVTTSGQFLQNPAAFDITNGGSLTVGANIKVSGNIPTSIFRVTGSGSLEFQGNVELSGASTAITMGSGTLSINQNGGKKIAITGAISSNGGTTNIKLDSSDDSINGAISATNGTTKLELSGGSQTTGGFTGNGNSTLTLTVDNSTFGGSVNNSGGTNSVTVNNRGSIQGNLTTSGTSLNLTMNQGSITQGVTSTANQNTADLTSSTITNSLSLTGTTGNSLTMSGGSIGEKLTTNGNGTNTVNLSNNATVANGFEANGTTTLTMNNATINGTSTISGASFEAKAISNSTLGSLTSNANTNTVTMTSSNATGDFSLNGTTSNSLTMTGGSIRGKLTASNGSNTISLSNGVSIGGGLSSTGSSNSLTINGTGATITGDVSLSANNGGSNTTSLTNANITGALTLSGTNQRNITINSSTIGGTVTTNREANFGTITSSTIGAMSHSGGAFTAILDKTTINGGITSNAGGAKNTLTVNGNSTVGDISLTTTSTTSGANTLEIRNGNVDNVTLSAGNAQDSNKITLYNSSTIKKVTTNGDGGLSFLLDNNSSVAEGIHTSATSTKVDIAAVGNSQINGTSDLGGADEVRVVFKNNAGAGTLNFSGNTNNLISRGSATTSIAAVTMQNTGTNQVLTETNAVLTLGSLSMSGRTNEIAETDGATNLQRDGANLTITGNASVTATNGGQNQLAFGSGNINGSLTTSGNTDLHTLRTYHIQGGVIHNNGNFNANLYTDSQISNGIQTSGTGNANVNLKNSSKLNGNSNFATDTNTVELINTSSINGNTTFSGNTNTLTANNGTAITGQVITAGGTATYTFGNNGAGTTGATVTGGIDTNQGATKTTANFTDSSILQNGTSTFHSGIDITFANTSKAIKETFNIQADTANITFKDSAEMQSGSITNNGGTANITFTDNAQMKPANGGNKTTITTNSGNTNLTADSSADLIATLSQTGGNFTTKFSGGSTLTGDATQTGGTSNITFQDQAKWTGNFTQHNTGSSSTITFHGTANMEGNITTDNGTTNITFDQRAYIVGDIKAQGNTNNVTFNNALLDGNLTLDGFGNIMGNSTGAFTSSRIIGNVTGYDRVDFTLHTSEIQGKIYQGPSANDSGMTGNFTDSRVNNGFKGERSINTLTMTNSQISNGVIQDAGKLTIGADRSVITGGFSGTNNSQNKITMKAGRLEDGISQNTGSVDFTSSDTAVSGGFHGSVGSTNTVTMTGGSLTDGIKQETGSLDFMSDNTDISGGFIGTDSNNTMSILGGNFNSGDIKQTDGSLNAEILNMTNLQDFQGINSTNVVQLSKTTSRNITQSGGSLEFSTQDGNVTGNISGTNRSQNKITITGSNVTGTISQTTGSMILTTANAEITGAISSENATFELSATSTRASSVTLTDSTSTGISSDLTLSGTFSQTRGTSTMNFSNTHFNNQDSIKFEDTVSASLIFTRSDIKDVAATRGVSTLNLSNSSMGSFTGNNGNHTLMLTSSTGGAFSQSGGSLSASGVAKSTIGSVTGTNSANITLNLNSTSKVTNNVTNQNGATSISLQDSTIGGNVEQTGGSLTFTADRSEVTGHYHQTNGSTSVNFSHSSIKQGVNLTTVTAGSALTFSQESEVDNGFSVSDSNISLSLLSQSKITGGFSQIGGIVSGSLDGTSSISGDANTNPQVVGLTLSNGITSFSLFNDSSINDGITATDNTTTILIDNSKIDGNITVERGSLDLTAQNNSTITSPQMKVTDADLKLTLDTTSKFIGNLEQTNNKQEILVKQGSTFEGGITNKNTTGTITINNATLTGSISQNGGTLGLDLSNGGKIGQNVTLTGVDTTLSGSGTNNSIGGNFSQTNGTLTGSMNGLTLTGTYSQNGGTSNVTFTNSVFNNNTTITSATSSSLTFDNSTLKGYTTSGGANNTLKLINDTKMNGTLTLSNGAQTTLTMDNSTLTGDNGTAITATRDSFLTFSTKDSEIKGKIDINTGGLKGTTDNTNITGDITLTDTDSNVSFTNTSTIDGSLTATDGDNTINFDNSSITGNVSQEGGAINLDLSNGSGIGGNLAFKDATANLTGSGAGNSIGGKFDSNNTTLTGDASGLNLKGTFTQTQGSSDIIFRNDSLFEGKVTLEGGTSDINFIDNSGIRSEIEIKNQTKASVGLQGNSFIEGNISVSGTNSATLSAQNNSTIIGDITLNDSTTNLNLSNQSSLKGGISQTDGTLNISASGSSTLTSDLTLTNGTTNITLADGSNLTGTITADNNPLNFTLRDNSSYNSLNAPQDISVTNADLTISASNNSVFGGNLTQTSNNGNNHSANLTFNSNSFYSGTMSFNNVTVSAKFNQSGIFSNGIEITGKSALFDFDGATNGGVIQSLTATNTNLTINTANQSHITINDLKISGDTLNLTATNSSRLTANVTLNDTTTATYTANTNGNLNVNTKIANQASTLTVDINGGMMQGAITQDPNGNNGFPNGVITLNNGGRWAVTDDTQAKELTLTNTEEQLYSDAIFASAFNSPLSFVDFTLDFADEDTTSRVGKAIIQKPQPQPNQPIPPAPDGSTYVRQLHLNEIKGNNGLFRVYADLGTNLADNILASKASGDHLIQVQYRAETFREIGGDRIVVAKVTDPSTTVSFKGTQSEIGLTKYDTEILKENAADGQGFEWIIGQATPAGMSYSSKIIASILQSQYRTFAIEIDSLDRRMGDLEFIKRDKGFWIRSFIGSNTKEATDYSTLATDNYYSIWSGFDYNSIGLTVHNYVGVFFNYTGINTESKDYTGKSSNIAFGFYNTFKAFSGFYADILAKYIYTISEFDISNYSLAKNSPKIDNHKFLLNAEIGYSFYYGEKGKSGYIQPQFQVTSGYIHKTDLSVVDVSGETINATIGRNFPVSIRAGAFWGQVFGEKIKSHIKLGTSFVYDVDSGGILNFSDSSTELQFKQGSDFRWVLSAATDFTFSEFFKLYASFDTSFFGNYNTTYSANLGIRFTFGRANNYVRNVPMVYSPYTPPVSIDNDKRTVPVVKRYTTKDIDQNYVGKPRRVESYIQGNSNPTIQQGNPTYTPSRQSHRDITSEVEF